MWSYCLQIQCLSTAVSRGLIYETVETIRESFNFLSSWAQRIGKNALLQGRVLLSVNFSARGFEIVTAFFLVVRRTVCSDGCIRYKNKTESNWARSWDIQRSTILKWQKSWNISTRESAMLSCVGGMILKDFALFFFRFFKSQFWGS